MHVKLPPMKLMKTGISLMGGKGVTKLVGTFLPKTLPPKQGPSATKLIALKGGPNDKTQRRFASRLAYLRSSQRRTLSTLPLRECLKRGGGVKRETLKLGATQRHPNPFELKAQASVLEG